MSIEQAEERLKRSAHSLSNETAKERGDRLPAGKGPSTARQPVWDPLLRLFHWLLVAAVFAAVVTGKIGGTSIEWHGRLGVVIAGLLAFRLTWGVIGPSTARFASFVRGPQAIAAYLRGTWHGIGHNPLGALSVVAMLTALTLQVGLGLVSYDEIAFRGPLARLLPEVWQVRAASWHRPLAWAVVALVLIHVAAILFYRLVKGEDLVWPMITGYREGAADRLIADGQAPNWERRDYWVRGAFALAVGVAVAVAASGIWLSPPPTAAVAPQW
jgi:cytochrome b